jgi:phage N-6-adenine-methyltransferase
MRMDRNLIAEALLSSKNQEWETPDDLFSRLHTAYNFTVDACATEHNKKLAKYWSPSDDGLSQSWRGERVWLNPPYHNKRPGQIDWVRKAFHEVKDNDCELVVCLLPARTDTKLFHEYVMKASTVLFVRGRLRFKGAAASAVFPSMVVVFERSQFQQLDPWWAMPPQFSTLSAKVMPTQFGTLSAKGTA